VFALKSVLVIDYAAYMRALLRNMLVRGGFKVAAEADTGSSAVSKYRELRPDLVTMGINLPGKDGIQALKEIRAGDPQAKVVIISAMGQESYVREAVLSGASAFVIKPVREEFLLPLLSSL
jgi:two-component system chemotaxis response regulator CheY